MTELKFETKKLWKDTLESLRVSISPATFSTWFSQTFIVTVKSLSLERNFVEIGCPSSFIADTLEKRYFGLIQDAINSLTGQKNDLSFTVKQNPIFSRPAPSPLFQPETILGEEEIVSALRRGRIRPGFTFENFAVSASNQMAHAAAEAVTHNLGLAYNPLLFWGGVGVGKTHLMLAIGQRIILDNPKRAVLYCTSEEFTTEIIEAIRNKTTAVFKKRYRTLDLLLLDDVQFLAGKNAVQEEFFHTFNAILGEGGQVVLTSDRPPAEIERLEERLRSRFEAGLAVDIGEPDFELRTAIALIKARERGIELSMEVAQTIAGNLNSARRIEGLLTRLLTQDANRTPITPETVTGLLGRVAAASPTRATTAQDVISAVAGHFSLGRRHLLGQSRQRLVVLPRQILMYLLRIEFGLPFEEVGRVVGGRDHTTIMYGVEKVSRELSTNQVLAQKVAEIKRVFQ